MSQTLTTNIVINATSNGFTDIGNTLTVLGNQIDGISQRLIGFGKESLKVYEDYDKNISTLQTVWGSNGTFRAGSKELKDALDEIDTAARSWAANMPFHTDDISNALVEAAHAGWDLNDMLSSMPAVMDLALAGNMDLSTSLDYVLKSMRALKLDTEDTSVVQAWTDAWVYAANRSAGTAEEFGDTFLRLGSVMQLAADPNEILALTAVMANFGTTGSAAGTMVRNSMLRLLAPSQTGKAFLDQLGATDEEINSIREDSTKLEAFDELFAHGFSVFDENGQAKPILQVYSELGVALAEIAGGYDNIVKNDTTLGILANVFGTRSTIGALNIIQGIQEAQQLYADLENGMATGTGEYSANIMMDSLWGRITQWESKVENLELRTGEVLAEQLEPVLEYAGGIVDSLAGLEEGKFNALVAGLEVLAGAGPALLLTGAAFRFIGYALTPAGGLGLGLIALTAAAAAIKELEEADFASKFGDVELDNATIQNYIQQLSSDFESAYSNVNEFKNALGEAVSQYTDASSTFKSSLISDMLAGVDISEGTEEYTKLVGLGEAMIKAIQDGINGAQAASELGITDTFKTGLGEGEELNNPIWAQIIAVMQAGYAEDIATAESLGKQLREAMTAAFKDGKLTPEEIANIQSIMDQMNEILAWQQEKQNYLERQRILRRAQTLGLSGIRETSELMEAQRNTEYENLMDDQAGKLKDAEHYYKQAIENGYEIPEVIYSDGQYIHTGRNKVAEASDWETAKAQLLEKQEFERNWWAADFNEFLLGLWTEGITSSELSDSWGAFQAMARSVQENNGFLTPDAYIDYENAVNRGNRAQAWDYLQEMMDALGGYERIQEQADFFAGQGNAATAQQMRDLLTIYDVFSRSGNLSPNVGPVTEQAEAISKASAELQMYSSELERTNQGIYSAQARMDAHRDYPGWYGFTNGFYRDESTIESGMKKKVELESNIDEVQAELDALGVSEPVVVNTAVNDSAVTSWQPPIKYMDVLTRMPGGSGNATTEKYAEGGRATQPSIFGDAGAEWAIPEEHTERTAELLNAARAASGFTWPDLLARFGGMNANAGSTPATLIYSPTIYANDAQGVADKLLEDKARLEKWFAEKQMLDKVEVYA